MPKSLIDKKLEEFDKWWDENMLLPTHKTSSKGTQRIWATAYSGREKTKSFLAKSLQEAQAEVVEKVEKRIEEEILCLDSLYQHKARFNPEEKENMKELKHRCLALQDLLSFLKELKEK